MMKIKLEISVVRMIVLWTLSLASPWLYETGHEIGVLPGCSKT